MLRPQRRSASCGAELMALVMMPPTAMTLKFKDGGSMDRQRHQRTSDSGPTMSSEPPSHFRSTTRTRLRRDDHPVAEPQRLQARSNQRKSKMPRPKERVRKTDFGTVLLHWILVITLTLSIVTGLRIAMDSPEHSWLVALDSLLPLYSVW